MNCTISLGSSIDTNKMYMAVDLNESDPIEQAIATQLALGNIHNVPDMSEGEYLQLVCDIDDVLSEFKITRPLRRMIKASQANTNLYLILG